MLPPLSRSLVPFVKAFYFARRGPQVPAAREAAPCRLESLESRVLFSAIRHVPEFMADTLGPADDASRFTSLGFASPVNFYGQSYYGLYVNNNGNVSFGGG